MKVYVSTWAKYNNGNLKGKWVDIEGHDAESFLEECREIHSDEKEPEFCYQDYEGIPRELQNENEVIDAVWAYVELDSNERKVVSAYCEENDFSTVDEILESHSATVEKPIDWAYDYVNEHLSENVPDVIVRYFDYEAYLRDAKLEGMNFIRYDNEFYVFHSL